MNPEENGKSDYIVTGQVRPDTINVVRIGLVHTGTHDLTLVGDLAFQGEDPNDFMNKVFVAAQTAKVTVGELLRKHIHIDSEHIMEAGKKVVRAVANKVRSAPVNRQGQRILKVRDDGSIPVETEDDEPVKGRIIMPEGP